MRLAAAEAAAAFVRRVEETEARGSPRSCDPETKLESTGGRQQAGRTEPSLKSVD